MKAIQIEYPEAWTAAAGSSAEHFETEARLALARKLFEMDRRTFGDGRLAPVANLLGAKRTGKFKK